MTCSQTSLITFNALLLQSIYSANEAMNIAQNITSCSDIIENNLSCLEFTSLWWIQYSIFGVYTTWFFQNKILCIPTQKSKKYEKVYRNVNIYFNYYFYLWRMHYSRLPLELLEFFRSWTVAGLFHVQVVWFVENLVQVCIIIFLSKFVSHTFLLYH